MFFFSWDYFSVFFYLAEMSIQKKKNLMDIRILQNKGNNKITWRSGGGRQMAARDGVVG